MKITVNRIHKEPEYTIGEMTIDGEKSGFTLEDTVREVKGALIGTWKIPGNTAIPSGIYPVVINMSQRFNRMMPLIQNVPGFTGVRIHPGNDSADTEGCILVDSIWGGGDWISGSRMAFNAIYAKIEAAWKRGEEITLEVVQ